MKIPKVSASTLLYVIKNKLEERSMKKHTINRQPYLKENASDESKYDLATYVGGLVIRKSKSKEIVELLTENKSDFDAAIRFVFNTFAKDFTLRTKFRMRKFWEQFGIRVAKSELERVQEISDRSPEYFYVPAQLDMGQFLKTAEMKLNVRFPNFVHENCFPRRGYSTSYFFATSCSAEHDQNIEAEVLKTIFAKEGDLEYIPTLNCFEYILSRVYILFMRGRTFDKRGWTVTSTRTKDNELIMCGRNAEGEIEFRLLQENGEAAQGLSIGYRKVSLY